MSRRRRGPRPDARITRAIAQMRDELEKESDFMKTAMFAVLGAILAAATLCGAPAARGQIQEWSPPDYPPKTPTEPSDEIPPEPSDETPSEPPAEPPSTPPEASRQIPAEPPPCEERFELVEFWSGVARIEVSSPCRPVGAQIIFELPDQGYAFSADFDAEGRARRGVPLLGFLTRVEWRDAQGRLRRETLEFPRFAETIQVVLIWEGPVDMDLLVAERPGSFPQGEEVGGLLHNITQRFPNAALQNGYGRLAMTDAGGSARHHAEVYVLEAGRNPTRSAYASASITPSVELVLEGPEKREACRTQSLAGAIRFARHVYVYGALTTENAAFHSSVCRQNSRGGRVHRFNPVVFSRDVSSETRAVPPIGRSGD